MKECGLSYQNSLRSLYYSILMWKKISKILQLLILQQLHVLHNFFAMLILLWRESLHQTLFFYSFLHLRNQAAAKYLRTVCPCLKIHSRRQWCCLYFSWRIKWNTNDYSQEHNFQEECSLFVHSHLFVICVAHKMKVLNYLLSGDLTGV